MVSKEFKFDVGSGMFGHSDIGLTLADIPLVLSLSQKRLDVKDMKARGAEVSR